jgi:hypothetical protein
VGVLSVLTVRLDLAQYCVMRKFLMSAEKI